MSPLSPASSCSRLDCWCWLSPNWPLRGWTPAFLWKPAYPCNLSLVVWFHHHWFGNKEWCCWLNHPTVPCSLAFGYCSFQSKYDTVQHQNSDPQDHLPNMEELKVNETFLNSLHWSNLTLNTNTQHEHKYCYITKCFCMLGSYHVSFYVFLVVCIYVSYDSCSCTPHL